MDYRAWEYYKVVATGTEDRGKVSIQLSYERKRNQNYS